MKKGISPMIAVTLLIAFAVAIGGILSVWFTSVVKTPTEKAEVAQEKLVTCAGVSIEIEEVRQDKTNAVNDTIVFSNPSSIEITNITLSVNGKSIELPQELTTLKPGEIKKFSYNITEEFSSVNLIGFCLKDQVVRGECKVGWNCWKE